MIFLICVFISQIRAALVNAGVAALVVGLSAGKVLGGRVLGVLLGCGVAGAIAWFSSVSFTQGNAADRFGSMFANPVNTLQSDRITMFDEIGQVITTSPFGLGMGRVADISSRLGEKEQDASLMNATFTESYLDKMIYETGIIGAILIVALCVSLALHGARAVASGGIRALSHCVGRNTAGHKSSRPAENLKFSSLFPRFPRV